MLNLTISHYIYLTREERYALHDGQSVTTTGVSIPVWSKGQNTSEPAKEVFCKYTLKNSKEEKPIKVMENGYEIVIPYRPAERKAKELSDEEWREFNRKDPAALMKYESQNRPEVSTRNLLDLPDGAGHLSYREHNKIHRDDREFNILHFVRIEKMESLLESLV